MPSPRALTIRLHCLSVEPVVYVYPPYRQVDSPPRTWGLPHIVGQSPPLGEAWTASHWLPQPSRTWGLATGQWFL